MRFVCTVMSMTAILTTASASAAVAQSAAPPLTSNRPGLGESESLVPAGAVQFESGFSLGRMTGAGLRITTLSVPEGMLRLGLAPRLELFASGEGFVWSRQTTGGQSITDRGGSDLSIDAKVAIVPASDSPFAVSIAGGLSLPTGVEAFSSGGVDPSVRLLWSRALQADFALGGTIAVASQSSRASTRETVGAVALGVSRAVSSSTSWFAEIFGALAPNAADTWTFNGGIAVVTGTDMQLDASGGRAVRGPGADWFLSAGITLRHRR